MDIEKNRVAPFSHNNNFNFLRLVLANLVLLAHAPEIIDGNRSREILTRLGFSLSFGELAVAGFFILSGYLIVQSWVRYPDPARFLSSRVKRIVPAFVVASLICTFIVGPIGSADTAAYFTQIDLAGYAKGLAMLQMPTTPAVFAGQPYPNVNGAMWTIYYEFRCYLAVLLAGSLMLLRAKHLWICSTILLVALCVADQNGLPRWQVQSYRLYLLAYFAAGGCFFLLKEKIRFSAFGAAVASVALIVGLLSKRTELVALCVPGGYLLFTFAFASIPGLKRLNSLPDVSYGAYLYGWPIQKLLIWFFPMMSPWILFPISVFLAIVAGALSWFGIEERFTRNKNWLGFSKPRSLAT